MKEPNATAGYLQDIEVYDDAEDAKYVQFTGTNGTVGVTITDETMVEFVEVAEEVFDEIHADMAEMRDILENARRESDRGDR